MTLIRNIRFTFLILAFAWSSTPHASTSHAAIASAHPLATRAGHEIMAAGGNAFDAAIAVTATLAVVAPFSSGLGGGGFALLHRANDGMEVMLDARETAPLAATRDMYLNKQGEVVPRLSIDGPLSAGIPGTPAMLAHLAERYGKLSLKKSLAPAIRHALNGFPVTEAYQRWAKFRLKVLSKYKDSARIFLRNNAVPKRGTTIKQPELAHTLQKLAQHGRKVFYEGEIADKLIKGIRKHGGIWEHQDLAKYRLVERKPLKGSYKGMEVTTAAPPSSGGIALLTMLNILAGYDLEKYSSQKRKHLIVEAMRRAYRDRAIYLGDPDFVNIPVLRLIHPYYAEGLKASINQENATPSSSLPGVASKKISHHTSHFSVLDAEGNHVSATMTINYPFGSGLTIPGTGVLLNDEMDDFSAKPGVPNVYGLVGAKANAIAPGKRPLSSMTPTFLKKDGRLVILGTPGGSRIISMVMLSSLEFFAGKNVKSIVARKRFHHQYLPDAIQYEPGALSEDEADELQLMGHKLNKLNSSYGNMHAIVWDKKSGKVTAASDPRGEGMAQVSD